MGLSYLVLLVGLFGDGHQCAALGAPKARTLHGHIVNSGRSHHKSGDTIVFKENIALDVIRDGMPNMRKTLKRQYIPEQNVSGNILATALYMSSTEDMIYREEVLSDGKVISYAFVHNNDSLDYINSNGVVLELPVDPNAVTDYITPPSVANKMVDRVNDAFTSRIPRIRRALSDELKGAAVIKLLLFIDKGAIDKFKPLNKNNDTAARTDLRRFFTLVVNEMTVMYQTLKAHGLGYTRRGVTQQLQDFAVQLVDVQFPAVGGNFKFATDHLANKEIVVLRVLQNASLDYAGLGAFSTFVSTYNSKGIQYDHAAWISGNDLVMINNSVTIRNTVGIAWPGTLCHEAIFKIGGHTSVNELTAGISRNFAHELGHGFGMGHDGDVGSSCQQNNAYIMGATAFPVTTNNQATFSKFSYCSAAEVKAYTLRIPTTLFRPTCLLSPDSAFIVNFCQGFTGTNLTLDDQCKRQFGAPSKIDVRSHTGDERFLQNNYVTSCVNGVDVRTILCNVSNTVVQQVSEVMMGTKCVKDGQMDPNNVCFHGACTSLSLCNTNNQPTTPTQPPPTQPPTTQPQTPQTPPTQPQPTQPPPTQPPTTQSPPTQPPPTQPPTTQPSPTQPQPTQSIPTQHPPTEPPPTQPPPTQPPPTQPPPIQPPPTQPPTNQPPPTQSPPTQPQTTQYTTTQPPPTQSPPTQPPPTQPLPTQPPTTQPSTTQASPEQHPTTHPPTTHPPPTQPPPTQHPPTQPPPIQPPPTQPPPTQPPPTQPPPTQPPTNQPPPTKPPPTQPPPTQPPPTQPPPTQPPQTQPPPNQPPPTQSSPTQPAPTHPPPTHPPPTHPPPTQPTPTQSPPTQPPPTQPPPTQPPPTQPPPTQPPPTQPPPIQPPPTQPPPTQPTTTQPPPIQPPSTQPPPTQSSPTQSPPTQPPPTQPPITQPASTQFPKTQPSTTQLPPTQPSTTQHPPTQPPTTPPPPTQPQPTQPQPTQPPPTQPTSTQPPPTQPPQTQPTPTQPLPTKPPPTQPPPTQPPPTQPPPTQPKPMQLPPTEAPQTQPPTPPRTTAPRPTTAPVPTACQTKCLNTACCRAVRRSSGRCCPECKNTGCDCTFMNG